MPAYVCEMAAGVLKRQRSRRLIGVFLEHGVEVPGFFSGRSCESGDCFAVCVDESEGGDAERNTDGMQRFAAGLVLLIAFTRSVA